MLSSNLNIFYLAFLLKMLVFECFRTIICTLLQFKQLLWKHNYLIIFIKYFSKFHLCDTGFLEAYIFSQKIIKNNKKYFFHDFSQTQNYSQKHKFSQTTWYLNLYYTNSNNIELRLSLWPKWSSFKMHLWYFIRVTTRWPRRMQFWYNVNSKERVP